MKTRNGFTLIETLLAVALFALVAGAVYAVCAAAMDAADAASDEAADQERLETFLRATRNALLSVPENANLSLRPDPAGSGPPDLVFSGSGSYFGFPDLAGGELLVSARPLADGTRIFSLARVSREDLALPGGPRNLSWLPLLARVERPRWAFFREGEWLETWDGVRPALARLTFEQADRGNLPVEAVFWIPPLDASPVAGGSGSLIEGGEEPPPPQEEIPVP